MNALNGDNDSSIKLRAGYHSGYLRIVFEGPGTIISKGKVSRKKNDIVISFSGDDFKITKQKLPVEYKREKNSIVLTPKNIGELKTFALQNPDRLVIDVYKTTVQQQEEHELVQKKTVKSKKIKLTKKSQIKKPVKGDVENNKKVNKAEAVKMPEASKKADVINMKKTGLSAKKAAAETIHNEKKEKVQVIRRKKYDYDDSFITTEYSEIWKILKSGKSFAVLKMLSAHKPDNAESIAIYHFIYGEAYSNLQKYLEAIDHFRLAYIYAKDKKLKEISLLKRGGLYWKLGLVYEAKSDYFVFIRDFRSSENIGEAHLNMGHIMSRMGNYDEAVEHYEKSGEMIEALFCRANALQRLEKVEEAREVYTIGMKADLQYIKNSPETYFLVGENMRMAGELKEAKEHLSDIKEGPYKDGATMSLGLIALEESDAITAIKKFKSLNETKDRKIKMQSLFSLHEAYIMAGRQEDAISALGEIRKGYPDSSMYKDALLKLSRLYKDEGRLKESVRLLKELVYGKEPQLEVFSELEMLLLEAKRKSSKGGGDQELLELWKEVGQWMLDESREDFLLEMTEGLKHKGQPFLELATWLMENASGRARTRTAVYLADFFAGMGNPYVAAQYLGVAKYSSKLNDDILRVEAKIKYIEEDHDAALVKMSAMKKYKENDLKLLGSIIFELKKNKGMNVQKAMDLYEKKLNEKRWDAEDYIRLADMLVEDNKKNKALDYYKIAFVKNPDDEWTVYRLGYGTPMPESKEMYNRLTKGDTMLSRLAKTKLLEIDLLSKVKEVY